jgi:hypothetical protein
MAAQAVSLLLRPGAIVIASYIIASYIQQPAGALCAFGVAFEQKGKRTCGSLLPFCYLARAGPFGVR